MVNIIVFNGGLGNQMFQYALFLSLKKRCPSLYLFDITYSRHCHNGFELFDIFKINEKFRIHIFHYFRRIIKKHSNFFCKIQQKESLRFEPELFSNMGLFNIIEGFWQSEKYFSIIKDEIIKKFHFRTNRLNPKTINYASKLEKEQFCSIHIRRGDYLENAERSLHSDDYYFRSMSYIIKKIPEIRFCVFSDDIDYCKANITPPHCVCEYVDWNKKGESWQDMFLMSKCHHNIIANSSFSWWGAMLNQNSDKIVIAPNIWFQNRENFDIIPEKWIKL